MKHYLGSTALQTRQVRTSGKWVWALVNFKNSPVNSNVSVGRELLTKGKDTLEKQEKAKKEDLRLLALK